MKRMKMMVERTEKINVVTSDGNFHVVVASTAHGPNIPTSKHLIATCSEMPLCSLTVDCHSDSDFERLWRDGLPLDDVPPEQRGIQSRIVAALVDLGVAEVEGEAKTTKRITSTTLHTRMSHDDWQTKTNER